MKKFSYIKEMKTSELSDKLMDETAALGKMKLNNSISPLENPMQLRDKRRFIARLNTEITSRNKKS